MPDPVDVPVQVVVPVAVPLRVVVPVLRSTAGPPVGTVRLHGRPLFLHAARSSGEAFDAPVVVGAPSGERVAVSAALAEDGLPGVPVLPCDRGLGELLSSLLVVTDQTASVTSEAHGLPDQAPGLADQGPDGAYRPLGVTDQAVGLAAGAPAGLLVVHDPRCPLTPAATLQDAVAAAAGAPGSVAVAARPMTDSVKELVGDLVRATVDRDRLRVLASPLVLPLVLLRELQDAGLLAACLDVGDLLQLVRSSGVPLVWTAAPALARRVDAASVALLEAWTAPA